MLALSMVDVDGEGVVVVVCDPVVVEILVVDVVLLDDVDDVLVVVNGLLDDSIVEV